MTGQTQDVYAWWKKAVANPRLVGTPELPVHENDPQPGRYRVKSKARGWDPVAIWYEDGKPMALRAGQPADPYATWTYACRYPIKATIYETVVRGGAWPDGIDHIVDEEKAAEQKATVAKAMTSEAEDRETVAQVAAAAEKHFGPGVEIVPDATPAGAVVAKGSGATAGETAPGIGHNAGLPQDVALDQLKSLERRIKAWMDQIGTVDNEEKDAQGTEFQRLVSEQASAVETAFRAVKDPVVKLGKQIDADWKPVRERAEEVKKRLSGILTSYRVARDKKRREEEAARRQAAQQVADAPLPAQPARAEAKGFRTVQVAVVTDPVAAATDILTQVPDQTDLIEAIRKVGRRMIAAGVPIKGIEIREEYRA